VELRPTFLEVSNNGGCFPWMIATEDRAKMRLPTRRPLSESHPTASSPHARRTHHRSSPYPRLATIMRREDGAPNGGLNLGHGFLRSLKMFGDFPIVPTTVFTTLSATLCSLNPYRERHARLCPRLRRDLRRPGSIGPANAWRAQRFSP